MNHFKYLVLLLTVVIAGQTCYGEYGPPAVLNCSGGPITVAILRADGKEVRMQVKDRAALSQPVSNSNIVSITGAKTTYDQADLNRLRNSKNVTKELWIVSAGRIDLAEFADLRIRRRECR